MTGSSYWRWWYLAFDNLKLHIDEISKEWVGGGGKGKRVGMLAVHPSVLGLSKRNQRK